MLLVVAVSGRAQQGMGVDCGPDGSACVTTKYGMGERPDFRWVLANRPGRTTAELETSAAEFGPDIGGASYFYSRSELANPIGIDCGPERAHFPLLGQILLRERLDCVPTSEGPSGTCEDGVTRCTGDGDCTVTCAVQPAGQGGGCRVSIPLTDGGITDPAQASELWSFTINTDNVTGFGTVWHLSATSGLSWSGTSDASNPACPPESLRAEPSSGTRYLLPMGHPEHDGSGSQTYVRWDSDPATRLRLHGDDFHACCQAFDGGTSCNAILPGLPQYPDLLERSCADPDRFSFEPALTNDWIFAGGRGTAFYSDPSFTVPGQTKGVCGETRSQGCIVGDGLCEALGEDCDTSEPGHRIRPRSDQQGNPIPTSCGRTLYVVRGTPGAGCTLLPRYTVDGDPGMQCEVLNYGIDHRSDANCDGVADVPVDRCPWLTEWDNHADADGDCADPLTCRGDECECGDQNLDGRVDVRDLLAINAAIFDPLQQTLLCDADSNLFCQVADILAVNQSIFTPNSTTCHAVRPPTCGDGVIDAGLGELCDDGAANDDGGPCSTICRPVPWAAPAAR